MQKNDSRKQTSSRHYGKSRAGRSTARRRIALGLLAAALGFACLAAPDSARAQSTSTSTSQLTISTTTERDVLEDNITSVVFTGAFALTLNDGQTLRPVFISREAGAVLNLGNGETQGESWTIASNSPSWSGQTNVLSGNLLTLANGPANPAGAWSETNTGSFSTINLYDGATLRLPARAASGSGLPQTGEVKIGALSTSGRTDASGQDDAVVEVGAEQTLTVENGLDVSSSVGLTKKGAGTLQLLANGTEKLVIDSSTGDSTTTSDFVSFDLGRLKVASGTFRIADGTQSANDVNISASSISVGEGAVLDVQRTGTIELTGTAGDVVFQAGDGSIVKLYVDEFGGTSFVAKTFNTYMDIGETVLDVSSSVRASAAPTTLTVFSTQDVGQTNYSLDDITVVDDLLGKHYEVSSLLSTADSVVLELVDSTKFADLVETDNYNEKRLGEALDKIVENETYSDVDYLVLKRLEGKLGTADLLSMTGEVYASSIGFQYMNRMTTTQTLFDTLRNNMLVAYSGTSAVEPMNYTGRQTGASNYPSGSYPLNGGYNGGAANGNFDNGPLYYNSDTNSYGPGVVPVQQGQPNSQQTLNFQNGGVYNGEYYGGAEQQGGNYNLGWAPRQNSVLTTMRGQEAAYGDPGTLIYSAWFAALGGSNSARRHKNYYGYDSTQAGFLAGLDLFGSCDCRFGAYYGYQHNEMKYLFDFSKQKTNEHEIGLYHQFGDETVYNILSIRGNYGRVKTDREIYVLGTDSTAHSKYDTWGAGATIERGANFNAQPFVFTPYVQADYNYLLRRKFSETSPESSIYALHVGKADYHSLRGQIGGRVALDMYPGEQQIRIVASAAYIHEFLNAMYGKTWASFQGFTSTPGFELFGNSMGRDWALLGLGADWSPVPALDLFVKGNYLVNKYTRNPHGAAGLKFRW